MVWDNAGIQFGGDNSILEEWLWGQFGMLALFLPPRLLDLSPIELVWYTMAQQPRTLSLTELFEIRAHSSASLQIMNKCSFSQVDL